MDLARTGEDAVDGCAMNNLEGTADYRLFQLTTLNT